MSMYANRPRSREGSLPWEQVEARANRAASALEAVFRLLDAHEDWEAEKLLDLISDRIHSEGPRRPTPLT